MHLLFGIGLVAALRPSWAKLYLFGGGIAYLLVTVYGFVVDKSSDANFLPVNDTDNILHIGLTAALLLAGVLAVLTSRRAAAHA